ncbi:hypothetical protein D3C76_620260 [compost metagenome]
MQTDFVRDTVGLGTQLFHDRGVLLHVMIEKILGHTGTQRLGIGKIMIHRGAGLRRDDRASPTAHRLFKRDLQSSDSFAIGWMSVRRMRQAGCHFLLGQGQ